METIAAFFDIDGTLYRENLQTELFKKMIKYNIISQDEWHKMLEPYYKKWDNRTGEYDDYVEKMSDIYEKSLTGINKNIIEFIAKQVINKKWERVYTFTRKKIQWHKEQGHKIFTISGSPIELVKEISMRYKFDDYRATEYLTDKNNNYTGKLLPLWDSVNKNKAIKEISNKYSVNLNKSYAYGDTSGDLSMFNAVKYPTCINPTKELLQLIKNSNELKNKINIIVERKDVIYNIKINELNIY